MTKASGTEGEGAWILNTPPHRHTPSLRSLPSGLPKRFSHLIFTSPLAQGEGNGGQWTDPPTRTLGNRTDAKALPKHSFKKTHPKTRPSLVAVSSIGFTTRCARETPPRGLPPISPRSCALPAARASNPLQSETGWESCGRRFPKLRLEPSSSLSLLFLPAPPLVPPQPSGPHRHHGLSRPLPLHERVPPLPDARTIRGTPQQAESVQRGEPKNQPLSGRFLAKSGGGT